MADDPDVLTGGRGRGRISLPERSRSPWWALVKRLGAAAAIMIGTVLLVYLDRGGYRDSNDPSGHVGLVDSIYYTTVTLSTTGYGDIAPVSTLARMLNAFVITPARIGFLVLLIGTTLEVLAAQGRETFRIARWRKTMSAHHVVVIGYGTKGRSAVQTLINNGMDRDSITVVDPRPAPGRTRTATAWPSSPATRPGGRCSAGRARPTPSRSSSPPTVTTRTCWPR